ncbi:MAG: hypothetical protein AB7T63_12855 [Planctomycetota bacterium]
MYTKKAELKVGILVLVALAILLGLLFFAGGEYKPWGSYARWNLRFAQGRAAPRPGDPVSMNGTTIGHVETVELAEEVRRGDQLTDADRLRLGLATGEPVGDRELREVYVRAVIRTNPGLRVPVGTKGLIETNIAGVRSLHLVPGTSEENLTPESTRSTPILAVEGAGLDSVTAQLDGALAEIRRAAIGIDRLATEGVGVLGEARSLLQSLTEKVDALDTAALSDEAVGTVRDVRAAVARIDERLATVLAQFEEAGKGAAALTADGREVLASVREDLGRVLDKAESALGSVDVAAKSIESLMTESGPKVSQFLDSMVATGGRLERFAGELEGLGPRAREILDNAGLKSDELLAALVDTAHNLFDASEDIRAHPWKLLNEPESDQIAYDNLRQASHSYLLAMRELNRSTARLETLLARQGEGNAASEAALQEALAGFRSALQRYNADEARWTQLFQTAAPRAGR